MSDPELIALVEQKSPEELTPDEIHHIRSRLTASPPFLTKQQ